MAGAPRVLDWDFIGRHTHGFDEFAAFGAKYTDEKIVDIVAKTWAKMSEAGHAAALTLVPSLPERLQALTVKAVTGG